MIAVMGAAGNVGGKVADLLVRQGQPVRALEHRRRLDELGRRGAEVVAGDLADAGDLGVLLKDVDAALVVLPDVVTDPEFAATRSRMSRVIADALRASPVEHVVALSTVAAGRADAAGPAAGLRELEQRLAELRDRHVLVLRLRVATRALGRRLGLPDLAYVQFPPDGVRAALVAAGMSEAGASAMVELQLDLNGTGPFDAVRRAADATAPTRLEEFLDEVPT